ELPMDKHITMQWWLEPASAVPAAPDERVEWLYHWWARIDAWIEENRAETLALAALARRRGSPDDAFPRRCAPPSRRPPPRGCRWRPLRSRGAEAPRTTPSLVAAPLRPRPLRPRAAVRARSARASAARPGP